MVETVTGCSEWPVHAAVGEEIFEHMVAEQEHELVAIEGGNRFKAAVGGPDSRLAST